MRTWLISDTHFFHKKIIEYCSRPFSSIEEMNETFIQNWNSKVKKDDTIYHLGDFALGKNNLQELLSRLNGRKILIRGNHDAKGVNRYYEAGFECVSKNPIIINGNIILSHRPVTGNIGYFKNIHGHCHWIGKEDIDNNHYDVSVDRTEFYPKLLDDIIKEKNW